MKKTQLLPSSVAALALFAAGSLSAQVTWDGGGGNSFWSTANNWSGDALPTGSDNVIVDANNNLRLGYILDLGTVQTSANSLTLDPNYTGGQVGVRGQNALNITAGGSITITSNYTDNSAAMFAPNTSGNLTLRSTGGDFTFVNNSAQQVAFEGNATRQALITGTATANETVFFSGSGDFLVGNRAQFAGNTLERVWTTDTYTGTLTLNNPDANNLMNPGTDFRILGGTLKIGASEQIADATSVAFGSGAGVSGTLDARGITETAGVLNNFSDPTATLTLLADATTFLTFAGFNDGGVTRSVIDIQGFVEGASNIIFTSLGAYDWTVAEGEAFVGLTVDGNDAFMTEVAPGEWAVTAVPEPGTFALLGGLCALGGVMLRRRR
jgi:hypothetical protein